MRETLSGCGIKRVAAFCCNNFRNKCLYSACTENSSIPTVAFRFQPHLASKKTVIIEKPIKRRGGGLHPEGEVDIISAVVKVDT